MSPRRTLVASLVLVAGLLLMHGLGTHGTAGHDEMSDGMSAAHHPVAMVTTTVSALPSVAADHAMGSCLTLLTLGLVLLLGGALRARPELTRLLAARVRALARSARPPDPPDLLLLSVCRC